MIHHEIVSESEWLRARKALLAKEKELTQLRDQLSAQRRALPWVRVDKSYAFQSLDGTQTLAQLFDGRSQLVIYHFMFGPEWEQGCKSCSFWADNFNGVITHLKQRDVTFSAVSRAPLSKLTSYARRLGWTFPWVSSLESDFNFDFQVSFKPEDLAQGPVTYNYAEIGTTMSELPGISVFYKDTSGAIFHTYSCYARGLDMFNTAYHYLDIVPKGRDEANQKTPMEWLRRHDEYGT